MKKLLLLPFLLLCFSLQAQTTLSGLPAINSVIERQSIMNKLTALEVGLGMAESHVAKSVPVVNDYYITEYPEDVQVKFVEKHKDLLKQYFEGLRGFGETEANLYFKANEETIELPYSFAVNNGMLTFVQLGVFSDHAVNTFNSDSDKRATIVAKSVLLPSMFNFKSLVNNPDIKYFSIVVGFLAKDFTDDSGANSDGETIAVVIPKSVLTKYINAELTDEEVFQQAVFYSENKSSGGNIKKIQLK